MIEPFEQLSIIRYLQNFLNRRLSSRAFCEVCDFLEDGLPFLGIEENTEELLEQIDQYQSAVRQHTGSRRLYKSLHSQVTSLLTERARKIGRSAPGPIELNIRSIAGELDLDEIENGIFALFVRYRIHDQFNSLLNDLTREHLGILETVATCLDQESSAIAERLRQNARLIASGVVVYKTRNGRDLEDNFDIPEIISDAMQKTLNNLDDIRKYILGEPLAATLEWEDFDHLDTKRDKLASWLSEVVQKQIPGVNILLWGPPGMGKTEFCKTLAARLNLDVYALGESDEDGSEPNRKERTSAFRLAQNLLRFQKRSLLLFDEMDDLFESNGLSMLFGGKFNSGSKVFTNRLFENNPVPTIWTINDASSLEESIIRRMALAIEMKVPPPRSREKVWRRLLEKHQIEVPAETLATLGRIEISPAIASNAVKFASLVGGSLDDLDFATQGIIKATTGRAPLPKAKSKEPYLPDLINSETDIEGLAERLCASDCRTFSLCLYGPSGTGKSVYLRYLADRLAMPVLFKRTSDLLSMWVGESEKNIARAFEEARDQESFLVFDEADSLLGDRRFAQHSWEVTQVNEMLTWMESHPLPFACTTNLKDRLDHASMRRFTFKYEFDYLTPSQVILAFKHFFGKDLDPRMAGKLTLLTPGDFAVVGKKLQFLGKDKDLFELIDLVQQEVAAKQEPSLRRVGFMARGT